MNLPLKKKFAFALLSVLASLVLCFLALEGAARLYLFFDPPERPVNRWDFRQTQPQPYHDSAYFGAEFLKESLQCAQGLLPRTGYYLPADFAGRYINISKGHRQTTGQPEDAQNRIFLFGGSTIFSQQVPDEHTIASYLQDLVNQAFPGRYAVVNKGVLSADTGNQAARLRDTPLQAGDLVVFYDGVNDVGIISQRALEDQFGIQGRGFERLDPGSRALITLLIQTRGRLALVRALLKITSPDEDSQRLDPKLLAGRMEGLDRKFGRNILASHLYASRAGARFVHVLQPHLFASPSPSPYERWLAQNDRWLLHNCPEAFDLGYPALKQACGALDSMGVQNLDLTNCLIEREAGQEFFLDFCHVTEKANQRVARLVFDGIFKGPNGPEPLLSPTGTPGESDLEEKKRIEAALDRLTGLCKSGEACRVRMVSQNFSGTMNDPPKQGVPPVFTLGEKVRLELSLCPPAQYSRAWILDVDPRGNLAVLLAGISQGDPGPLYFPDSRGHLTLKGQPGPENLWGLLSKSPLAFSPNPERGKEWTSLFLDNSQAWEFLFDWFLEGEKRRWDSFSGCKTAFAIRNAAE